MAVVAVLLLLLLLSLLFVKVELLLKEMEGDAGAEWDLRVLLVLVNWGFMMEFRGDEATEGGGVISGTV